MMKRTWRLRIVSVVSVSLVAAMPAWVGLAQFQGTVSGYQWDASR
jgi:hypothetical protein